MTNLITSLITSISILFSTFFPSVLGDATTNKCGLPPPEESTLSQYAKKRQFNVAGLIGECFRSNQTNAALCKQIAAQEYASMFMQYQDTWRQTEKTQGFNDFTRFDEVITFARNNNMKLHFYHLIWTNGKTNSYTPTWLFTENNCGTWTRSQLLEIMKTHIQTTMIHGADTVTVWNVVNEAFSENGAMSTNCFKSIIGLDYIDKAFEYAHEIAPNAILVLNDAVGKDRMHIVEVDAFFKYVKNAKARGIQIDAVGLENHLISTTGEQFSAGYLQDLNYYFQKAQDANVKVLITEMDVYQAGHSQEDVANLYKKVTAKCLSHSNCISLGTWGISDKYSWVRLPNHANLTDAKPLLFDENYQRKPAYYGVMDAIRENTTRPCVGIPSTTTQTPTPTFKPTNTPVNTPFISATPTSTQKTADINGDGKVNMLDYNILLANFKKTGIPGFIPSDIDKNGKVDIFDYNVIVKNFNK
ncbi:MAG: endo-1,4-beta-xylanase [Candidatus Gottesmanbacteria bacterium]